MTETYSNSIGLPPLTTTQISDAVDKMRMVKRGQPSIRSALQMAIVQVDMNLCCAKVELCIKRLVRSYPNDFGHGIFDSANDPEHLAVLQKVASLGALRTRIRLLLLRSRIRSEKPSG